MAVILEQRETGAGASRTGVLPGLLVASIGAAAGWAAHERWPSLSPHVVAVALGAVAANAGLLPASTTPGLRLAGKRVLRVGIVLLGFRLSLGQVFDLGPRALAAVVLVVLATFTGTQWLGRRLGLTPGLSLLVATGYSICGASAIAAAEPFADASDEDVAYSIGLVTICGSLAIVVLPVLGRWMGLSSHDFGAWVGASVHDVGQVVAAASTRDDRAVTAAVVVKLTRVAMLAPLLAVVALRSRRTCHAATGPGPVAAGRGREIGADVGAVRPPVVPGFVALFLVAVAVRTSGLLDASQVAALQQVETIAIGMGLVGLGSQVRIARLRQVGGRPLVLGLASWVLVAGVSLLAVTLVG
jgi:uncharacterized integral membrane protein (TIGR00698 family)